MHLFGKKRTTTIHGLSQQQSRYLMRKNGSMNIKKLWKNDFLKSLKNTIVCKNLEINTKAICTLSLILFHAESTKLPEQLGSQNVTFVRVEKNLFKFICDQC